MQICSDKHPEVCYSERVCPVCDVRSDLEGRISDLEGDLEKANETIERLEGERER